MKRYALDTNIVSYLLKENPTVSARLMAESANNHLTIPLMVYYEVKRGLLAVNSSRKIQLFERFCELLGVEEMDFDVLDKAAYVYNNLRSIGRLVEDADIIIAAFCIVNDCILVTNNTKHFEHIDDLQLVNWAE
jgi:predicted nucleic acid-binding protein